MKVTLIHMLNNYTGSPNVLAVVAKGLIAKGVEVKIITGQGHGFLSDIDGVKYNKICYKWSNSKIKTLVWFILAHIQLFFITLFSTKKNTLYYINTILPFSAAIACKLTNKKIVYHCHENMKAYKPFYNIYRKIYKWTNCKSIFVSKYVQSTSEGCRQGVVIYNGLDEKFEKNISLTAKNPYTILMICSLRRYKGVYEFIELAKQLPKQKLVMVVSDSEEAVHKFIEENNPPPNLTIYPRQENLHPFYQQSKLLLSLSNPNEWVETFGLTILEAMVYGIPSIVPNAGGPTELIENNRNGLLVDPQNIKQVLNAINTIINSEATYQQYSENALKTAQNFSNQKMINSIYEYIKL